MYPHANRTSRFPVGIPEILTGDQIDTENLDKCFGLMQCQLLAPRDLKIPFLPFRTKKGKLISPLCAECAQILSETCTHGSRNRSWEGCYTTVELNKAVELGYEITAVYEVCHWEKTSTTVFGEFMDKFIRLKLCASEIETGINLDEHAAFLNEVYGFNLTADDFEENPTLKTAEKPC